MVHFPFIVSSSSVVHGSSAEHCYLWSELNEEAAPFAKQTITAKSGTSPATGLYFSHNNDAEVHNEK